MKRSIAYTCEHSQICFYARGTRLANAARGATDLNARTNRGSAVDIEL